MATVYRAAGLAMLCSAVTACGQPLFSAPSTFSPMAVAPQPPTRMAPVQQAQPTGIVETVGQTASDAAATAGEVTAAAGAVAKETVGAAKGAVSDTAESVGKAAQGAADTAKGTARKAADVATSVGGVAGGVLGGAIGSVFGPVGTLAGAGLGAWYGHAVEDRLSRRTDAANPPVPGGTVPGDISQPEDDPD